MPLKHGKRKKRQNGKLPSHRSGPRSSEEDQSLNIPTGNSANHTAGAANATTKTPSGGRSESLPRAAAAAVAAAAASTSNNGRTKVVFNMEAFRKFFDEQVDCENSKVCAEYKRRYPDSHFEQDVETIKRHFIRTTEEDDEDDEPPPSEVRSMREELTRAMADMPFSSTALKPITTEHRNQIQTLESGRMVFESQWLAEITIKTYVRPTEWKLTELIGMDLNHVVILGRNGSRKTIVEFYNLTAPEKSVTEKIFTFDHSDPWQFGAMVNNKNVVLGCFNELGILNVMDNWYWSVDVRDRISGWGDSKKIRALAAKDDKIIVGNDKDRIIVVFDPNLQPLTYIVVQELVDFIWSLSLDKDRIYLCSGFYGNAFAIDMDGKTLFHFRKPEADSSMIPSSVLKDCDGFLHVFWLVKTEDSYRSVDYLYNPKDDQHLAEVRFDKKVQHMSNVSCATFDTKKSRDGHTVVMTDKGQIFVSATTIEVNTTYQSVTVPT